MAIYSKIEVSENKFMPLSTAEPYIGRIQHPLAKLSRILAVHSKIEVSDDEFTPLSEAEPNIGRIQQNRGVRS